MMKQLKYEIISTPSQVESMRLIYNDNLDMLSTKPIPRREYQGQQDWWHENKHALKAFLYERLDQPGKFMAFLVIRDRGGFFTPILAIDKSAWGKGFGREIIHDYLELAGGPLAGSQLKSNRAICYLNSQFGWQVIGSKQEEAGEVELLYHPGINPKVLDSGTIHRIADYLNLSDSEVACKTECR